MSGQDAMMGGGSAHAANSGGDMELAHRLAQLPAYSRSLLRIQVPVVVTLAMTRQPVSRVIDLAPGTILHFSKACDEPLEVSVGGCDVAVGEAVKVGDKFGLRVTSMVMPEEKFEAVKPMKAGGDRSAINRY
jgi:flagellar motor switch/type III secretory pathway protein FliN